MKIGYFGNVQSLLNFITAELVLKIDTLTSSTEGELILLEAYLANGRNSHYLGDSGDCSKKCQDFVFGYIKGLENLF